MFSRSVRLFKFEQLANNVVTLDVKSELFLLTAPLITKSVLTSAFSLGKLATLVMLLSISRTSPKADGGFTWSKFDKLLFSRLSRLEPLLSELLNARLTIRPFGSDRLREGVTLGLFVGSELTDSKRDGGCTLSSSKDATLEILCDISASFLNT
jgi:hypothetical protein